MDALVLPFLLAALAELGSPGQMLALALVERFRAPGSIAIGILLAATIDTGLAAAAGAALGPAFPDRARHLLLGIALILIGLGRIRAPKRADHGRDWQGLGAFGASLVAYAIVAFGGEVQMAVAAFAAGGRSPWLVAPAAAAGMTAASLLPLAGGEVPVTGPVVRRVRWAVAALFGATGLLLALGALELI